MTNRNTLFQELTGSAPEQITIAGRILSDDRFQVLHEGKWVNGRYEKNIRIDRNSHFASVGADDIHAHVYGRRDRDNALVAVRLNGRMSHNTGGRLHQADADVLRSLGFNIPADNIVETFLVATAPSFILNEAIASGPAL
ncbi:hypothetical protein [Methylobacterium aerolatum]|uniref:FHA domain-containing protein n=1 Tax=Methylobacterium aerolatum TaxID=418708 RepID=A0ABU0I0K3_9HYPH|nr:hypothetical protein [Methylobacterium aerolatum]MDQ0448126.1 hypothetical protein [Methylobacterium aerolatum]